MAESASQPKYRRGQNPRALANLTPPWTKADGPNPAPPPPNAYRGPIITPALRRLAAMPMADLRELLGTIEEGDVPAGFTVAEAIALVSVKKALTDSTWGDKTREYITERIDGKAAEVEVNVNVGVGVVLKWDDN